jgi:2-phospho-L-lactate guanylyltransferase
MNYRALIPVKALGEAKSRLADHLTKGERAALVLNMLRHVIEVLQESKLFEHISVVSADMSVLEQAQLWGARSLIEKEQGHNPALHTAALEEIATGAQALLTISADLPFLQANDIRKMVEQAEQHDVVLAPSSEGTGTNALLVHPPLAIPYVFGPGSLQRYLAEARERHLRTTCYTSTGLTLDIDTIEDLDLLCESTMGNTFRYEAFSCLEYRPQ